jgi:FixJ family two-component response regulator
VAKKAKRAPKRSKQAIQDAVKRRVARNRAARAATLRQRSVDERLRELGLTKKSSETWSRLVHDIGQSCADGSLSTRKRMLVDAKRAYDDAILNSDDIKDWIAAACKEARLD